MGDLLRQLSSFTRNIYLIDERLATLDKRLDDTNSNVIQLHEEVTDLRLKVAVLEEARNTIEARVRAVVAETVADLRVQYAEWKATHPAELAKPDALPTAPTPRKSPRSRKN